MKDNGTVSALAARYDKVYRIVGYRRPHKKHSQNQLHEEEKGMKRINWDGQLVRFRDRYKKPVQQFTSYRRVGR